MAKKKISRKAAKKAPAKTAPKTAKKAARAPRKTTRKTTRKAAKKAARKSAPKTSRVRAAASPPSRQLVAETAYRIYLERLEKGLPGDQESDWLAAEEALRAA